MKKWKILMAILNIGPFVRILNCAWVIGSVKRTLKVAASYCMCENEKLGGKIGRGRMHWKPRKYQSQMDSVPNQQRKTKISLENNI